MMVTTTVTYDTRVRREAQVLTAAGHAVTILCAYEPGEKPYEERVGHARVEHVFAQPSALGRRWFRRLSGGLPENGKGDLSTSHQFERVARFAAAPALAVLRLLTSIRIGARAYLLDADVYHAHDVDTLMAAGICSLLRSSLLVYDAHELATEQAGKLPWERAHAEVVQRLMVPRASAAITVSEPIARLLATTYGVPEPTVVRNIPERVDVGGPRKDLRQDLDIPNEHVVVLHQGQLSPHRGLETLVRAVGLVDGISLIFVGPDRRGYRASLRRVVHRLGLTSRVRFVGRVPPDDLPGYTRAADIGATLLEDSSLNHRYALPNKLFEYIHAGIPVLGSDLPEIRRIVDGYGVGVTCDPDDPADVARAMSDLMGQVSDEGCSEELMTRLRRAAGALSWQEESVRLVRLYESLGTQ